MFTVKQLETFYWVAELGTIQRAADRLHITQSAATKRLQELESLAITPLFPDQNRSKSHLTQKGREMAVLCKCLLEGLDELERLPLADMQSEVRAFRIGITEHVALTWYAGFCDYIRHLHPNLTMEAEVHESCVLSNLVTQGILDFAFSAEPVVADSVESMEIGAVALEWIAPGSAFPGLDRVSVDEMSALPIIDHPKGSTVAKLCATAFASAGVEPRRLCSGAGVAALITMVETGLGIACVPMDLVQPLLAENRLRLVRTQFRLPYLRYCAIFPTFRDLALARTIAETAKLCFSSGSPDR